MKPLLATIAFLLLAVIPLRAEQAPFDMSTERPKDVLPTAGPPASIAAPATTTTPAVATQPASVLPGISPIDTSKTAAVGETMPPRRYVLPSADFVLTGENVETAWVVYLTPEQAASGATFNLGYQNAVVVAPEASRFSVFVNGTKVVDAPIASSEAVSDIAAVLPANLLRAGFNDLRVEAVQRHRTDCTIELTYELWTQFDPKRTFLSFSAADAGRWKRVDDLRAVGLDAGAATTFNLVVPGFQQEVSTAPTIRLAEGLALLASMPNQSVTISATELPPQAPGSAIVVVGTASELTGILSDLPDGARTAPVAAMIGDPRFGSPILVVTGPTWQAVGTAIETLVAPVDLGASVQRKSLSTRSWRSPDPPMLFSAARLKLSDLGVVTSEFSGRRFRTDFTVGVPSDFFANSYGEATVLLDAAYSDEVLPGSHIDIYVNDDIAATMPITNSGGDILQHLPIKVTTRHFRPGSNKVGIEAILMTAADAACAPGATMANGQRFAFFDTSEFVMPDFARIGQRPNLAALAGTGFPYARAQAPVVLVFDHSQPPILAAAATLLARLSAASGRLVPVQTSQSATALGGQNAIFIGPVAQLPATVVAQVGLSERSQSSWGDAVAARDAAVKPDTETALGQWRQRLDGGGWHGQVNALKEWLAMTFNLSVDSFRLVPGADPEFTPAGNVSLVVAQQASPLDAGTWTVVTAPTARMLEDGVRGLTAESDWQRLGGHITSYDSAAHTADRIPGGQVTFVPTQPASFSNYRLIAANWLSANALSYSLLLTLFSILLGLATAGLLGSLGRKQ